MNIALQLGSNIGKFFVPLGGLIGRTTDNQRSTCLINQNRVDFIYDGEEVIALNAIFKRPSHVVT